jgi:hypothetical protein
MLIATSDTSASFPGGGFRLIPFLLCEERCLTHASGVKAWTCYGRYVQIVAALRRGQRQEKVIGSESVMPRITASPALSHLRVLDLTRVRAGPTCVRVLADFGADVIKIEAPPDAGEGIGGPRHGFDMQNLHRNKRSITLNLKTPEGVAIFKKLVATADVVVENYRPDVKARLGIGYDVLRAINKRIILASISGFGETGPYRMRAGLDQIAQGMGGLMWVTGMPGQGPVRAGAAIADSSSLRRRRHSHRAHGTRAIGRRAVGGDLAAAGADRDDGFSGGALSR